jgi:MFS family permease
MKHQRLILWSITASLAGFLFGFDTIVISGAEQAFQNLWKLDGNMHGWAVSAALWGTVIGSMFGGIPAARFGRRVSLIAVGFLYFVSAIGSGLAPDFYTFFVARFIGGLGVGAATVVSPMFISEIAPANNRGKLAGLFQFNIVLGILVAFISNALLGQYVNIDIAWRWMLGIEAVPAMLYTLMTFTLPESPRWLITHAKKVEEGEKVFRLINPEFADDQIKKLVDEVKATVSDTKKVVHFWTKRLQLPILLAILVSVFNQFSGINIILYYAPRLMGLAGITNPLLASASLGVTNLIFTFVGLYLIDKAGRRSLLYLGGVGYVISLGVCALMFLSTPGFKVVSTAGDVIGNAGTITAVEAGDKFMTPEDKQELVETYTSNQSLLIAASKAEKYTGTEVVIPADSDTASVIGIAEKAIDEAKGIMGSRSMIVLICLIGFIASHAVGQGAVIWVLISEIFPNDHRAAGTALGSATHWVCAASLTYLFPVAIASFEAGYLFAFFAFCMIVQLVWITMMVPETKGVTLEEMEKKLGITPS